jgi:NADH-quinone oxidoreductase subunit N
MNLDALQLTMDPLWPALGLILSALLVMTVDIFNRGNRNATLRALMPWVALVGVLVTAGVTWSLIGKPVVTFQDAAILDRFAIGLDFVVLAALALGILLSVNYIPQINKQVGEYYALLLLVGSGMMLMGAAIDLIVLFLALEIFSLGLYILSGLNRHDKFSSEAAMKYFLLGAFASAFLVYGSALIYGATGSTQFEAIATVVSGGQADSVLLYAGIALLLVGLGFKVSLVPFHAWTPDVYQGAPTPVTVFLTALPSEQAVWGNALAVLAVLTMTLGNLVALRQSSLKRLLAYSGIAHAGYILVGLAAGTPAGAEGALFYLISYAFMNIGVFAVIILLEKAGESDALDKRAHGLAGRRPWLAAALAIFLFSLAGMPPFAGFFGKFYVFAAAVEGGMSWLAAIAMLNSAIGAFYYLSLIVSMYFRPAGEESAAPAPVSLPLRAGLVVAVVFTLLFGLMPGLWISLLNGAAGAVQVAVK